METHRRVKREAPAKVAGNEIVGVKKANFITLVDWPANQRAFSVLRSDKEENQVSKPANRVTRTRRSDANPVQALSFPVTYTDEQVNEHLKSYDMESYVVQRSDDSVIALRSDLQSIADDATAMTLTEDGVVAYVNRSEQQATPGKTQLAVVTIEFDEAKFTREDAEAWLRENSVDFAADAIDNSSGNIVLKRMDVAEGEEARTMELSDGVTAQIIRNDVMDIPDGYVAVISEAAYSGWGWGQLDFAARLSDVVVGQALREGLDVLYPLLRDTLFYSPLPVELRKELTQRALNQFGLYAAGLLDSLPRQLLISVSNTQRTDLAKEPEMSKTPAAPAAAETEVTHLTRDDVAAIVKETLKEVQRTDEPVKTEPAAAAAPATEPASVEAPLTRADLQELLAPLGERLKNLEGTAVVRSDKDDPVVEKEDESTKRSDLWAGTIQRHRVQ